MYALIDSFALETGERRRFVRKFRNCQTHDVEHADRAMWPCHLSGDIRSADRANQKIRGLVREPIANKPVLRHEFKSPLWITRGFHAATRTEAAAILPETYGRICRVLHADGATMARTTIYHERTDKDWNGSVNGIHPILAR